MRFLSTYAEPGHDVGIGRVAGAAEVLLFTSRADTDGILHRALTAGIKWSHVEDVDTLHLSEDFETLETSRLLEVGRDGAGLGTRCKQVFVSLYLCTKEEKCQLSALVSLVSIAQLI